MLPDGNHFSMREYMDGIGCELIKDGPMAGYVRLKKAKITTMFVWTLSDRLPNPEDFILARSQTTLEDIYRANEWESQRPSLPAPMVMDGGPVQPLCGDRLAQMPRNQPVAMHSDTPSSTLLPERSPQPNRKQRKAKEAQQRKATQKAQRVLH